MTLLELLNKANEGYDDGFLNQYYDRATGKPLKRIIPGRGDGLAEFIVVEIAETYNEKASDEEQVHEARRVMCSAIEDIEGVIAALEK